MTEYEVAPPDVPKLQPINGNLNPIEEILPFVAGKPVAIKGGGYLFPMHDGQPLRRCQLVLELTKPEHASPLRNNHEGRSDVVDLRVRGELAEELCARVRRYLERPLEPKKPIQWGRLIPGATTRDAIHALAGAGLAPGLDSDKKKVVIPLHTPEALALAQQAKRMIGGRAQIREADPNAVAAGEPSSLILTGGVARSYLKQAMAHAQQNGQLRPY